MTESSVGNLDSIGTQFFSRDLIRSRMFLVTTVHFGAVFLALAGIFIFYWNQIQLGTKLFFLLLVAVRARNCIWLAVVRHRKVRAFYFPSEAPRPPSTLSDSSIALDVAAQAILDDLFYTAVTLLGFLLVVIVRLHGPI